VWSQGLHQHKTTVKCIIYLLIFQDCKAKCAISPSGKASPSTESVLDLGCRFQCILGSTPSEWEVLPRGRAAVQINSPRTGRRLGSSTCDVKNTNPSLLLPRIVSELICTVPDGHNSSIFCFTSTQTSFPTFKSCMKSELQIKYDLHRHFVSWNTVQTDTSGCYKHVNKNLDFLKMHRISWTAKWLAATQKGLDYIE